MAESIVTDQAVYLTTWTGVQKAVKRTTRTPISSYVENVEYLATDGSKFALASSYATLAEAKAVVRQRLGEEIAQSEANIVEAQQEIEGYRKALAALEAMEE